MPCTPIAESASRTSSSLNGLMIAATSFIGFLLGWRVVLERPCDKRDQAVLAPVPALVGVVGLLGIGALVVRAGRESAAEVVRGAELPHGVAEERVVLVVLVAEDRVDRDLVVRRDRPVHR